MENGSLIINALQENYGGNAYTSARLRSIGDGNWTYGRVVVRARKGGKTPFRLLAPVLIHDGAVHLTDGDDYSATARGVLRHGEALPFA